LGILLGTILWLTLAKWRGLEHADSKSTLQGIAVAVAVAVRHFTLTEKTPKTGDKMRKGNWNASCLGAWGEKIRGRKGQ
jgi:hypothetical protein